LKFDSLTVLDYIKTSIEILMQIKDEGNDNGKNAGENSRSLHPHGLDQLTHSNLNTGRGAIVSGRDLNDTGLSSTFKSIDLPPKEYE
jgi:hypothetical protein